MDIRYLNTDLVIESKSDLSKVVEEFGDDVIVLYHGETRGYQLASFEIDRGATSAGADEVINTFCELVENLPEDARGIWDGCCSRVFDVGYQSGSSPHNYRSEIRPPTIQRVAAVGASIITTIYSLPDEP